MPNSNAFRRPWIFTNVDEPTPNKTWIAEYMAQHDLPLETALEHLSKKMRDFLADALTTANLIDRSDEDFMNECKMFVETYVPMKDFYAPIPKVKMFKDDE